MVVTGAAGGVGSVAIILLARLGYHVIATTGRMPQADYLRALGAAEVVDRAQLAGPARPLGKERWAGGIDAVGSHTLANLLAMTQYGGTIAACGLAQGMDLVGSVAPFILRGVTLAGIDSVMAAKPLRLEAWRRLALDLDKDKLRAITTTPARYGREPARAGTSGRQHPRPRGARGRLADRPFAMTAARLDFASAQRTYFS